MILLSICSNCIVVVYFRIVNLDAKRSEHVSIKHGETRRYIQLALAHLLSPPLLPFIHSLFSLYSSIYEHFQLPASPLYSLHELFDFPKGFLHVPEVEVSEEPPRVIQCIHVQEMSLVFLGE